MLLRRPRLLDQLRRLMLLLRLLLLRLHLLLRLLPHPLQNVRGRWWCADLLWRNCLCDECCARIYINAAGGPPGETVQAYKRRGQLLLLVQYQGCRGGTAHRRRRPYLCYCYCWLKLRSCRWAEIQGIRPSSSAIATAA